MCIYTVILDPEYRLPSKLIDPPDGLVITNTSNWKDITALRNIPIEPSFDFAREIAVVGDGMYLVICGPSVLGSDPSGTIEVDKPNSIYVYNISGDPHTPVVRISLSLFCIFKPKQMSLNYKLVTEYHGF